MAPKRVSDHVHGRMWSSISPSQSCVTVLSSEEFLNWLDTPQQLPRPGASSAVRRAGARSHLLEHSTRLSEGKREVDLSLVRMERQFVFRAGDQCHFRKVGGYSPLVFNEVDMPSHIRAAIIKVQEIVASAQYGDTWREVVTPLSIQVTKMPAGNVRGDHEDLPQQGDFIATYTASGSGTINIERTLAEERARRKSICKRHTKRSQIRRHQKVGSFYGICAASRWNCKHGVQASGAGRVSLTYRFNLRECVD